jgi:hypothetical protein
MAAACAVTFSVIPLAFPTVAAAQTDYFNTDVGRPITIEDAYAVERYAFDIELAPFRLERLRGGIYRWGLEPELAYGILPRTQLEIGFPLAFTDFGASRRRGGLEGIDVSVLHNLNIETAIPAISVAADVLIPAGGLAPDRAYASAKGIMTRTYRRLRFHINGRYTFGAAPDQDGSDANGTIGLNDSELSRWLGGVAVDRTFPLKSLLITGEVFARQPIHADENVEWNAGAGIRYQLDPFFALDAGVGRRLTGSDRAWFVTFGLARAFAIRSLMPGR